jgi:hypothetical protein
MSISLLCILVLISNQFGGTKYNDGVQHPGLERSKYHEAIASNLHFKSG